MRLIALAAALTLAVGAAGCGGGDDKESSSATTEATTATTTETISDPEPLLERVPQSGVTLGEESAPATLYEFADLQCPFCRDFSKNAFPQVVEKYVKTGKVKMVFRNLTFIGPDSVTAARAAAAAGQQNKLWSFVEAFYANQGEENSGYVTDAFLAEIANDAGVDPAQMKADMGSPEVEKQLGEAQQAAKQFGVNSTPSFLLQVGNAEPTPVKDPTNLDAALNSAGG